MVLTLYLVHKCSLSNATALVTACTVARASISAPVGRWPHSDVVVPSSLPVFIIADGGITSVSESGGKLITTVYLMVSRAD